MGLKRPPKRPIFGPSRSSGIPRANTLPLRISLAAFTMSSGVTWFSVPLWSSLPQRPQFDSFFEASAMAALLTLMFIALPSLIVLVLRSRGRQSGAILRRAAVLLQAGAAESALHYMHGLPIVRPTKRANPGEKTMKRILIVAAVAAAMAGAVPAQAADPVADWTKVSAPAAPALKPVTVDPKTTALLMLDFMNQNCGKRPSCLATIPAMKKLLAAARTAKATVVYSIIANTTPADVIKDVAPEANEPHVKSGPDKFVNTDLDKILKDKGIKTVIAVGTSSNGAVLYT